MKKTLLFAFVIFQFSFGFAQNSMTVFDAILFYDGYAGVVDFPTPEGVIRQRNDLYSKKLSETELAAFGNDLTINVTIAAACDNYDRIGNVNLAFVPKGATTYIPADVQRLELGRFITPFMNKNLQPTEVPYTFTVNNVASIFKDADLLAAFDIWAELEVFGVPYAANTQVAGCAGRNDVFYGTLEFVSTSVGEVADLDFLLPLNFKKDLNNYTEGASDAVGTTVRTINFDLPTSVENATFHLITSNHGANANGEEYNRRNHHIDIDGVRVLTYRPGGISCEPYRVYNTQGNGIYGPTPRPLSQWQSFSNWCPGQVIPNRTIAVGNLAAGSHSFKISVPFAVFPEAQGYIPVSVYLQGKAGTLGLGEVNPLSYSIYPNPAKNAINIQASEEVKNVEIYTMLGQQIWKGKTTKVDLSSILKGIYIMKITFANNKFATQKFIRE